MPLKKNIIRLNDLNSSFVEEFVQSGKEFFGEELLRSVESCIQCGCCAGSCPVSEEMDYTPRQIVRMIQLGFKEEVLTSNTMWICASCFSCSVRCPRGIRPAELMEALKPLAIAMGTKFKHAIFDEVFSDVVRKKGRASEYLLLSRYSLSDPGMVLKQIPFGISLIAKGKHSFFDQMDDNRELGAIFKLGKKEAEINK